MFFDRAKATKAKSPYGSFFINQVGNSLKIYLGNIFVPHNISVGFERIIGLQINAKNQLPNQFAICMASFEMFPLNRSPITADPISCAIAMILNVSSNETVPSASQINIKSVVQIFDPKSTASNLPFPCC
jgi:hypothetical protein